MAKSSSKKRERTDEDVAADHDAKPAVKKSKLDGTGKAKVTKKVKEAKPEPAATEEAPKVKKEKKDKKDKEDKKEKKDKKDKTEKKEKKDKKSKKSKDAEAPVESESPEPATLPTTEPETKEAANGDKKSSKKDKKKDKKKKTTAATPAEEEAEAEAAPNDDTTTAKSNRFIVFVGNLPFSATADMVRAHFATLQPTSVRLLTQRDNPSKSRGIAFVEFAGYDHMKTCLAKFHHSEFADGSAQPRRINVELTFVPPRFSSLPSSANLYTPQNSAGGGGKTAARQDKIKAKNAKLNEERAQRMKREEEAKYEKAMKGGGQQQQQNQEERDEQAIHPSRRGRVPYGRN